MLGHIIDTERVMCYRMLCFSRNEVQSMPGFDQDVYVKAGRFNEKSLEQILDFYNSTREATLSLFKMMSPEDTLKTGMANNRELSVRALGYLAAGHELHHIGFIKDRYL